MRSRIALLLIVPILGAAVLVAFLAHTPSAPTAAAARQRSLFVLSGAGMRPPMDEIGKTFEKKTGIQVKYTYAGSACLLTQIDTARQGDAYMPGEKFYLDQARERDFVVESRDIAYIIPVILVSKGNPKHIRTLEDLVRPDVRVGLGDAKATAVGKQADVVLKRAGLTKAMKAKRPMRSGKIGRAHV